jgi:pimeloyl-ACP methyl ester carboxylesterase
VVEEFLPLLARLDGPPLSTTRIGLTGWSMGGYGAVLLAERLGASRVAAVAAVSPALWTRASDAAAGAFDDAEDFARHDVFAGRERLRGLAVRVDCGSADPFVDAARAFVAGPAGPGGGELRLRQPRRGVLAADRTVPAGVPRTSLGLTHLADMSPYSTPKTVSCCF